MPELERIPATRIVAAPAALDTAVWPDGVRVLRIAPDEAFVLPPLAGLQLADPHAIITTDLSWAGRWLPAEAALALLERECEWELPRERPAFAQGAIAGLPGRVWLEAERVLLMVPAPLAADFEERMA